MRWSCLLATAVAGATLLLKGCEEGASFGNSGSVDEGNSTTAGSADKGKEAPGSSEGKGESKDASEGKAGSGDSENGHWVDNASCAHGYSLNGVCWEGGESKDGSEGKDGDGGDKTQVAAAHSFTHVWNGVEKSRSYDLVEPSGCVTRGMLVVLQPEGGGCSDLGSLASNICVHVLCPYSAGVWKMTHSAGDSEDVEFIAALVQNITSSRNVPAENVILTGFSAGGTMAYRVGCERSDVVGGLVPYGQAFLEPAAGHIEKGQEGQTGSMTEQVLQLMQAARQTSDKCNPQFKRPHFAVVGTQDNYYGRDAGVYDGQALWEFYSTNVMGCVGSSSSVGSQEASGLTGQTQSSCFKYESCSGINASLNKYCTVEGMFHVTTGWDGVITKAFHDFFSIGSGIISITAGGTGSMDAKDSAGNTDGKDSAGSTDGKDDWIEDSSCASGYSLNGVCWSESGKDDGSSGTASKGDWVKDASCSSGYSQNGVCWDGEKRRLAVGTPHQGQGRQLAD
eukprot:TRINITY_DN85062_c0_g1_i1.p1 TRINITY_DN85062_c0_g1~~TRINITY_DN85062_c0_g1_i1.p1  ORF type:complete len:508 (+),score=109.98 TRINITY_DN85062_c0_g1_i1:56-1579(+)